MSFDFLVSAVRVGETLKLMLGIATFSLVAMTLTFAYIKRLHDIDTTGWAALFQIVPFANVVMLVVMCCKKGTGGPNSYGEDPLATAGAEPLLSTSFNNHSDNS